MEISLVRHGKSKHVHNKIMTCNEFNEWVRKYDDSGIFEEKSYPLDTLNKVSTANIVITSDLKRSIDSAKFLNPTVKIISSSLFRETELPIPSKSLWGVKLKPKFWAVALRCLWFTGYSDGCESLSSAQQRASIAATELVEYAQKHKSVAFVRHGFINRLIAKELQNMGWKGKRETDSKHWGCTTYTLFS